MPKYDSLIDSPIAYQQLEDTIAIKSHFRRPFDSRLIYQDTGLVASRTLNDFADEMVNNSLISVLRRLRAYMEFLERLVQTVQVFPGCSTFRHYSVGSRAIGN